MVCIGCNFLGGIIKAGSPRMRLGGIGAAEDEMERVIRIVVRIDGRAFAVRSSRRSRGAIGQPRYITTLSVTAVPEIFHPRNWNTLSKKCD
jgi:hypothetical protein